MDSCCSSFAECASISGPAQSESCCSFMPNTPLALLFFSSVSHHLDLASIAWPLSCFLSLLPLFAHSSSSHSQQVKQLSSFDTDVMTYCRLEHRADGRSSFRFVLFPPANLSIHKTHVIVHGDLSVGFFFSFYTNWGQKM